MLIQYVTSSEKTYYFAQARKIG